MAHLIRNPFDQYGQPENRLTHALVCSLANDARLLKSFLRWATGERIPRGPFQLTEQRFPGEPEEAEVELDRKGVPDAWIYTEEGWCLLIESKAAAPISMDQLRRHFATATRRGFHNPRMLVLTARSEPGLDRGQYLNRRWSEIYTWAVGEAGRSRWARTLKEYLEVAEAKLAAAQYLREGTLTVFSGFPFNGDTPYTYLEGKRLLRLALEALRQRKDLAREIGMDSEGAGRPAITGSKQDAVWDFLPLKAAKGSKQFTAAPHLTLAIKSDSIWAAITIPNAVKPALRARLRDLDEQQFEELFALVTKRLTKAFAGAKGSNPWVEVVQRHYLSQRSQGYVDARLEFDPRTAFGSKRGGVKYQPEWLDATRRAFQMRRSNIQLMVGAVFPYARCPKVRSKEILDVIAQTWIACKPILDVMLSEERGARARR